LTIEQTRDLTAELLAGPPMVEEAMTTRELLESTAAGAVSLPGLDLPVCDASLEQLRAATVRLSTAASGLVVLVELYRRTADRTDPGWLMTAGVRSAWQPSLLAVLRALDTQLQTSEGVANTLWWVVDTFIIKVHERIAYSKLQQREHTFRFRWEDGAYQFYDNGIGRFPLAAIRDEPLTSITRDVGFWQRDGDGVARLTPRGHSFVEEVLL
jgi:hypothetical protein